MKKKSKKWKINPEWKKAKGRILFLIELQKPKPGFYHKDGEWRGYKIPKSMIKIK